MCILIGFSNKHNYMYIGYTQFNVSGCSHKVHITAHILLEALARVIEKIPRQFDNIDIATYIDLSFS